MSTETDKTIVRQILETLDRQEYDTLETDPGLAGTLQRQPLIRRAFPDLQTTVELQVAEGDMVATMANIYSMVPSPGLFLFFSLFPRKRQWNQENLRSLPAKINPRGLAAKAKGC